MRSDLLIAAAVLATQANAFWGTAHLLLARRAQDLLQSQDNAAYQAVLAELEPLKQNYPSITEDEGSHPMTECATFADNIKGQGYSFQAGWHFIDQPYYPDGDNNYPFVEPEYNAVGAMDTLTQWLSNSGTAYKSSYYYTTIKEYFPDEEDARSFALRLVIHYVGDIHQPLHATTLVNDHYDDGDAGGNFEHLPNICGASNLHAVWDSVAYMYCGYPDLPLDSTDWNWYTTTEQSLAGEFPIDYNQIYEGQFQKWADISYQYSISNVYAGELPWDGDALSSEYVTNAANILQSQIMYGGYRLNKLLQSIYGTAASVEQTMQ